jgi:hypothetical protein
MLLTFALPVILHESHIYLLEIKLTNRIILKNSWEGYFFNDEKFIKKGSEIKTFEKYQMAKLRNCHCSISDGTVYL